ncbi:hypothetical protein [Streptomyces sp. NPDC001068]|uniref:hypothetical protein n=1 Tax=Streptomyces sp. NPDC001068 TaxID=3364544 RepID=UPI0036AFBD73
MAAPALYGIAARRVENGELIACDTVFDLVDLPTLLEDYRIRYADRADVLIALDTTPLAAN